MKTSKYVQFIIVIIAMVFVLSIASIVLSLFARKANHDAHQALETQAEFKRLGLQLMDASDFLTQQAQTYVQYGEKRYLDAYWNEINNAKNRDKAIEGLKALGAPQNELDLVAKAGQLSNTLALLEAEAFDEIAAENFERARELMFGPLYDKGKIPIIKTMDEFQNVLNDRTRKEADRAKHSAEIFQKYAIISIIVFAVFVICGLVAIYYLVKNPLNKITEIINALSEGNTNVAVDPEAIRGDNEIAHLNQQIVKLIESLKKKEDFTTQIGSGNFSAEYVPQSDHDTLGNAMIAMQSNLIKADQEAKERKTEEEQRNWSTSGLAKFAEILRKDNDKMEALSYNVISNMVKYLGANQGGIFVLNDDDRVLEMKACYAFDRKKFIQKKIHPGEGLVGTCYLEGEPIYMTEVPDSYIIITSGLGEANPKAVYICPLKVNDRIYGVMELASFDVFEPYQLEFVQKVSESIAATISTVQVNIRTERLLAQSKLQAEEMANQEEELRQNMEEMQSTQEEMRRREIELGNTVEKMREVQAVAEEKGHEMGQFSDAIFETYSILEFTADGFMTNINKNMLLLFGVTDRSVFVGKHSSEFIGKEAFETAWANLRQGKKFENVVQVEAQGKMVKLRQRYVPICNRDGKLLRVLVLVMQEEN